MRSVELISVPVTDQQRAKAFYLRMGLTLVVETTFGNGQQWIQLRFPEGGADITLVTWFEQMPPGCLQAVVVHSDDIEKDVAVLKDKGIETGTIDKTPWGLFCSIPDPDGNRFVLHQK
ncbi:MAG TPA: VOC family protein [Mucilaginibacter sp.]|nr:VOC family protein [Mucilaginibacter sp.]